MGRLVYRLLGLHNLWAAWAAWLVGVWGCWFFFGPGGRVS